MVFSPNIPFLDLKTINAPYQQAFRNCLDTVNATGKYILSQEVDNFEKDFANYCNVKYAIGVGSGLDALRLILESYNILGRLQKGDHILVPANTFVATILAVVQSGLQPIFVEPNPITFTIDPSLIASKITKNTKAILPTHLYGQLADLSLIRTIAKKFGLLLISDAAQAHGAEDRFHNKAGSVSDAAAFSFYPTKNLGALGDGGAILTNDPDLNTICRRLRNYGSTDKYHNAHVGYNSRLDSLQAAFLTEKLKFLDAENQNRRTIARTYLSKITNPNILLPYWDGSRNHVFHLFVVRVIDRTRFCNYLQKNSIGYGIHYPVPPHKQTAFRQYAALSLPITEAIHNTVVSLPLHPQLKNEQIERICHVLNNYSPKRKH